MCYILEGAIVVAHTLIFWYDAYISLLIEAAEYPLG